MKTTIILILLSALLLSIGNTSLAKPQLNLYLGVPYMANPLGEGEQSPYAPMPLFREDGFDCTTYVETVLAHYKSHQNKHDFNNTLMQIRYIDGKIDFFSRAHLMEYHWIPNAIKYKFIKPYPLTNTINTESTFNLRQWFLKNSLISNKDEQYMKNALMQPTKIKSSISYIPSNLISRNLINSLPNMMVVFFVKALPANSWLGQDQAQKMITHMGLLIDKSLYHASRTNKKVLKIDLQAYLKTAPSIIGISLYEVRNTTF